MNTLRSILRDYVDGACDEEEAVIEIEKYGRAKRFIYFIVGLAVAVVVLVLT
ncbi:hypothetical protein [Phaeodactylibacter xiamenensis]|jgi:hypothetical protein|uniref:hypothetical protein n=1 Tax=Phaeodactylibacter xiamenensis TaxID=1524460 RepID=UPI0024A9BD21|nr:hypothetical protein [Phaeodactylibacter xiamenensis]